MENKKESNEPKLFIKRKPEEIKQILESLTQEEINKFIFVIKGIKKSITAN